MGESDVQKDIAHSQSKKNPTRTAKTFSTHKETLDRLTHTQEITTTTSQGNHHRRPSALEKRAQLKGLTVKVNNIL